MSHLHVVYYLDTFIIEQQIRTQRIQITYYILALRQKQLHV